MSTLEEKLKELRDKTLSAVDEAREVQFLDELREKIFSRKTGELSLLMKELREVAEEVKPKIGALANEVKIDIEKALGEKMQEFGVTLSSKAGKDAWIDPTMSFDRYRLGHLHPMTIMMRDLHDIFSSMGFIVLDGPEVESQYYNFEGLNIPEWHPARDSQDTFYIEDDSDFVLRTHTSPVQVRAMQEHGAPLRAVVMGRVYRNEATDASHDHSFHQIEGLMIDKNISIANLIATMKELVSGIYEREMNIRLRPGYFPFVEPGFELDISCVFCESKGCSVCKQTGWIEMGGSGLVHPTVLEYGGIDPKKYSGFAFGMGVTRLLMLRYGIDDIRHIHSGDLRFLGQF